MELSVVKKSPKRKEVGQSTSTPLTKRDFIKTLFKFYQDFISIWYGQAMSEEEWEKYIECEEKKYKKLGHVECPAFGNEKVYFNHYGLEHLMYKGRVPRPRLEVVERFGLVIYAPSIIKRTKSIYKEEKRVKGKSEAYFWTIKDNGGGHRIRIILRRLNTGTLHFFSIMDE